MNKRTARRLAAATALVAPGAVGIQVSAHAAPTILTPSPNSTVGGRSVTIFAQYNAPRPVASAKLFLDNLLIATRNFQPAGLSGTVNLTWDSTAVIPGTHRITIKMYDRSGALVAQEAVPVSIVNGSSADDTIPPQVAILAPSEKKPVQGTFDIKVLATDNSGKDPYVSVFVDQELRGVSNKQPYAFSINSTEYANGSHSVEAWAYDTARNKATANAVNVNFNNPGGATALNEEVNGLAESAGKAEVAEAPEPMPATGPALPEVATPQPQNATFPVEGPTLAAMPPQPTAMPAQKPITRMTVKPPVVPKPAKVAAKPAAPAKPAPAKPTPAKPGPPKPLLVAAPPPIMERRNSSPRPSLTVQSSIPLIHIPPVPEVKIVSRPEPEPVEAPIEAAVARGGIEELPTDVAPVEAAPTTGIQEIDMEPVEAVVTAAPLEEAAPTPVAAPVAPVVPMAATRTAPIASAKPVPAKTRIAKALPEPARPSSAPKATAKPVPSQVAMPVPQPAAPKGDAPGEDTVVETVAAAPAPIVLTMRGERVIEEAPAPRPRKSPVPKPAPKRTMVARADAPKPVAPVRAAAPAKPVTGNPAPKPARLATLPQPTAPATRATRPAHSARITANTTPTKRVVDLRPEIIRELPADRVAGGHIRHAVRPGETMNNLARAFGVPVKRLLAANHLGRRHDLRIGQEVAIPAPFRVAFNNETVQFDVAPRIENGVTLAALRSIYEQAGGSLTWNPARREVRATGAGANIIVRIGSTEALVNGHRVRLSAPAFIDEGRTFLPVEFIGKSLGLHAEYDLRSGAINLRSAHVDADIRKPA